MEPDDSYYIENAHEMAGKTRFNLRVDPAPDLVAEIDVTHSSKTRMAIYAKLMVAEVWRWSDAGFQIFLLTADGSYAESQTSKAFPQLPLAAFREFLTEHQMLDVGAVISAFLCWLKKNQLFKRPPEGT